MITKYFIQRKIRKLSAKSPHRPHHSLSWDKVHSLLILYNRPDHEKIQKILDTLRKENKEVYTCVFLPAKTASPSKDKHVIPMHEKDDISLWGFPKKAVREKILVVKADILIDLTRPDCLQLHYAALLHACAFKVGIIYPEKEWYDLGLSLTDKKDVQYSFEQILFYLRSIRSK